MTRRPARLGAVREFIATENGSAVVMLTATVIAMVWANSPWSGPAVTCRNGQPITPSTESPTT